MRPWWNTWAGGGRARVRTWRVRGDRVLVLSEDGLAVVDGEATTSVPKEACELFSDGNSFWLQWTERDGARPAVWGRAVRGPLGSLPPPLPLGEATATWSGWWIRQASTEELAQAVLSADRELATLARRGKLVPGLIAVFGSLLGALAICIIEGEVVDKIPAGFFAIMAQVVGLAAGLYLGYFRPRVRRHHREAWELAGTIRPQGETAA
jgi:hypothetical protein